MSRAKVVKSSGAKTVFLGVRLESEPTAQNVH